ncbi:D-glycerate dehydrogenase [Planctomycetaceae bacterium SCGC AG-212-D15]|nr:D-glycerate dehydrogenase [Planctomycetaceae bacterium SCGC AG-212-D15]
MAKPKVFVTRVIPESGLRVIQENCDAEVWPEPLPPPYDLIRQKLASCDGLVSLLTDKIDAALMDASPRLRVVSNYAVGFNNIDIPAATQRGIAVGNTPGVLTDATADMAFCLLIGAARRIVEGHAYSVSGQWKTWEPLGHLGQDLAGRTLGVVGMGRIGFALAKRCHAGWDMKVLYYDVQEVKPAETELDAKRVDFETLLRESDFISVHTDLNEKTRGMFSTAQFKQMKKTAVFINTARGPLVDQKALSEALQSGTIFAAGLDVTDPEPPAPDDPLLRLPNLIVAPHIASATVGTRNAMADICASNLIAGLKGEKLPAFVNPDVDGKRRK